MRRVLADLDMMVHRAHRPFFLALLAEAHQQVDQAAVGLDLVDQALALVEELDDRWWEAALHRLKGHLLLSLAMDNAAAAEACYERAISGLTSLMTVPLPPWRPTCRRTKTYHGGPVGKKAGDRPTKNGDLPRRWPRDCP